MLCDGSSFLSISKGVGVSPNTVAKLLVDAGEVCIELHNALVREVRASRIRTDKIWSFDYGKAPSAEMAEDSPPQSVWTWTAIDQDTKLIVSYLVGDHFRQAGVALFDDLRARLADPGQLTEANPHLGATEGTLGREIDDAQRIEIYTPSSAEGRRHSRGGGVARWTRTTETAPNTVQIGASKTERSTLGLRTRVSIRQAKARSNKLANHFCMVALYVYFYNFMRREAAVKGSPGMAASLAESVYEFEDLVHRIDRNSLSKGPGPPWESRY